MADLSSGPRKPEAYWISGVVHTNAYSDAELLMFGVMASQSNAGKPIVYFSPDC